MLNRKLLETGLYWLLADVLVTSMILEIENYFEQATSGLEEKANLLAREERTDIVKS